MDTMKFLVIYEKSREGYSAYVPDLPGCTSAGADREEIAENILEAVKLHLEVMRDEGLPIPSPKSESHILVITGHELRKSSQNLKPGRMVSGSAAREPSSLCKRQFPQRLPAPRLTASRSTFQGSRFSYWDSVRCGAVRKINSR